MSIDVYLTCITCREKFHIGQESPAVGKDFYLYKNNLDELAKFIQKHSSFPKGFDCYDNCCDDKHILGIESEDGFTPEGKAYGLNINDSIDIFAKSAANEFISIYYDYIDNRLIKCDKNKAIIENFEKAIKLLEKAVSSIENSLENKS